jgi:hypothetical protein
MENMIDHTIELANRTYILFDKRTLAGSYGINYVAFPTGYEVIDDNDINIPGNVPIDKMRSDETSTPGNDNPHRPIPE